MRLVAEVPLGLSERRPRFQRCHSGHDEQSCNGRSAGVKTFSVGYDNAEGAVEDSNEFEYARLAAKTFGADHHEYRLKAQEFQDFIPDLVWHLDEPMADPSCIPLYFISRVAREHVTVILSGEGADEALAGYNIYTRMLTVDRVNRGVPGLDRMAPWPGSA